MYARNVFVWSSVHVMLQEAEKKQRSRHGPRCGHTPLDIAYRKVYTH